MKSNFEKEMELKFLESTWNKIIFEELINLSDRLMHLVNSQYLLMKKNIESQEEQPLLMVFDECELIVEYLENERIDFLKRIKEIIENDCDIYKESNNIGIDKFKN